MLMVTRDLMCAEVVVEEHKLTFITIFFFFFLP
jgi:hypothetical protein